MPTGSHEKTLGDRPLPNTSLMHISHPKSIVQQTLTGDESLAKLSLPPWILQDPGSESLSLPKVSLECGRTSGSAKPFATLRPGRQISAPTETVCFDPIIGRADIYISLVRAPPRQASAERSAATTQECAAESCEPYVIFLEPVAGPFATG